MTPWTAEERLEAELEDTLEAERKRRGLTPASSFIVAGQIFALRADRSRCPERLAAIADVDPENQEMALGVYKEVISGEIRHSDKKRWMAIESELDFQLCLELVAWIMAPFLTPISKEMASHVAGKALAESAWPT